MDSSYRIRKHEDSGRSDRHGSSRDHHVGLCSCSIEYTNEYSSAMIDGIEMDIEERKDDDLAPHTAIEAPDMNKTHIPLADITELASVRIATMAENNEEVAVIANGTVIAATEACSGVMQDVTTMIVEALVEGENKWIGEIAARKVVAKRLIGMNLLCKHGKEAKLRLRSENLHQT